MRLRSAERKWVVMGERVGYDGIQWVVQGVL